MIIYDQVYAATMIHSQRTVEQLIAHLTVNQLAFSLLSANQLKKKKIHDRHRRKATRDK